MTRLQLMTIANAMTTTSGLSYVTVLADQLAVCNRRLAKFTERTRCLFDDAIPFTLSPTVATYDLRGGAFTKPICWATEIVIDSIPVRDLNGNRGLLSLDELQDDRNTYRTDPASRPFRAARVPPTKIRLYPAPDQAYPNCFASGYTLHPVLSVDAADDNTVLSIPDEYCETAAVYVAIGLVLWTSDTESDYERMGFFSKAAAEEMEELQSKTESQISGSSIRGNVRSLQHRGGLSIA